MRDILPKHYVYWDKIHGVVEKLAQSFGYKRIELPIIESTNLFERTVGQGTDIVEKEMYTFYTKSKERVTLRPEFTASIARAFIENGMRRWPKPVKLFSIGPLFRYERPQQGRYRQHHQINFEALGGADPILDAQVILLAYFIIKKSGVKNIKLLINSIGCPVCRRPYLRSLVSFLKSNSRALCLDCKKRLKKNPLRVLDCKEEKCQPIINGAPQLINSLCEQCHPHFKQLLEYLDELNLEYMIDPALVRGLDYYTKTVFEFISSGEQSRNKYSFGGGGRYDELVKTLGGPITPAIGFGIGLDRLALELEKNDQKKAPKKPAGAFNSRELKNIVFLVQLGDLGKKRSLFLFHELVKSNIQVSESFQKGSIKSQLKSANSAKAKLALIIGQKEALDQTAIIRNMEVGSQETIPQHKLISQIKKIFRKK